MRLEAVTVAYDYSDYFRICAEQNARHIDNWVVVSHSEDSELKEICDQYNNIHLTYYDMDTNRVVLDKHRPINHAVAQCDKNDWLLVLDADTILPSDFRKWMEDTDLDPQKLYLAKRRIANTKEEWKSYLEKGSTEHLPFYRQEDTIKGFGYFQLAHCSNRKVVNEKRGENILYPQRDNYRAVDTLYAKRWPENKREIIPFPVIHLGSPEINVEGRVSSDFNKEYQPSKPQRKENIVSSPPMPQNNLTASIITTCKGREYHLEQTMPYRKNLKAASKGFSWEHILVDYNDPDNVGEKYKDQTKVVKANVESVYFNISHARNIGARKAKGEYLAFLDADTIIKDPCWLAETIENMKEGGHVLALVDDELAVTAKAGTCIIRKDIFWKLRGYDEQLDRFGAEDTDLYQRAMQYGSVYFYPTESIESIEHSNEIRTEHYPEKNKGRCVRRNKHCIASRQTVVNPDGWGEEKPMTRGILTAAHAGYFKQAKLLIESIRATENWPIMCISLELTPKQKNILLDMHVDVVELDDILNRHNYNGKPISGTDYVRQAFGGSKQNLWFKPWYTDASRFQRTIWIDCDTIVTKPLSEVFEMLNDGFVIWEDGFNPPGTPNPERLYTDVLPLNDYDPEAQVNSGVYGFDANRDRHIIDIWKECVIKATESSEVAKTLNFEDQGALIWALNKTGSTHRIQKNHEWNRPANYMNHLEKYHRKVYNNPNTIFQDIANDHPDSGIVHWMSRPKLTELRNQKVILAFLGRSGSQMITSHFRNHSNTKWFDEELIYAKARKMYTGEVDPYWYIQNNVWDHADLNKKIVGFNYKWNHAGREVLKEDKSIKVVVLHRRNILERISSWLNGLVQRDWNVYKKRNTDIEPMFRVNPEAMEAHIREQEEWYEQGLKDFADHEKLHVYYEDLVNNGQEEWDRVTDFLGIERTEWAPKTVKVEDRPMSEVFTNWQELQDYFKDTRWAWMFED